LLLAATVAVLLVVSACDETPGPQPLDRQPPRVVAMDYAPDSIRASDLPPEQVQDSVLQAPLAINARVRDPDGDLSAVLFTLEPAAAPQATAVGTLRVQSGAEDLYAVRAAVSLPAVEERYTLRVYAVDTDSLFSNQAVGQIRVLPSQ
jgi:hypothetical protein